MNFHFVFFFFLFPCFFLGGGGGGGWTVGYYERHKALKCKYMSIGFQSFVYLFSVNLIARNRYCNSFISFLSFAKITKI
jgi:hypothetical protein